MTDFEYPPPPKYWYFHEGLYEKNVGFAIVWREFGRWQFSLGSCSIASTDSFELAIRLATLWDEKQILWVKGKPE